MLALNEPILVMCVRANESVTYAVAPKIVGEGAKFTTPVSLNFLNKQPNCSSTLVLNSTNTCNASNLHFSKYIHIYCEYTSVKER